MFSRLSELKAEGFRSFFTFILFFSIPFSIAGDDFAIIGLYLCTGYLLITKKEKWPKTIILYGMLLMVLGSLVSSIVASNFTGGLQYLRAFWRFGLPFMVFMSLSKRPIHFYLNTLIIVSSIIAVYAIVQSFTGLDVLRSAELQGKLPTSENMWYAVGAFSHHLTYGGVTLILFSLFAPSVLDRSNSNKQRMLYAIGALFNLSGLFLSLGRSIWMGAIASIGVMVILKLKLRMILLLFLLFIIGLGAYTTIDQPAKDEFFKTHPIGRRIGSITLKSNKDRILMWTAAINIIKDNPVFGVGPKNSATMQPYYDELAEIRNHRFQHKASVGVHNIYLQNWVNFGLIGLLGYFIIWMTILIQIFWVLKTTAKKQDYKHSLLMGLFSGFIGIMIAGLFENNFRDGEVQTAIFTAIGLALVLIGKIRLEQSPKQSIN